MRATTILSVIGLMATAAYAAPADESMLENALDKRAGCSNTNAHIACQRACDSVVQEYCRSCGGVSGCVVECQRAHYKTCYKCCDTKCSACA
ncbi:hypothetical protein VTI28DRAFT_4856 [Corynascus sepedonium]